MAFGILISSRARECLTLISLVPRASSCFTTFLLKTYRKSMKHYANVLIYFPSVLRVSRRICGDFSKRTLLHFIPYKTQRSTISIHFAPRFPVNYRGCLGLDRHAGGSRSRIELDFRSGRRVLPLASIPYHLQVPMGIRIRIAMEREMGEGGGGGAAAIVPICYSRI